MKKLTSRKFWVAIIGFVSALLIAFGVDELRIEQLCTVIGALGTLCAYIFAEGYADAKGNGGQTRNAECEVRNDEQAQGVNVGNSESEKDENKS